MADHGSERPEQAAPPPARKPYSAPKLRVFGSVAAITSTVSMSGTLKDGGPNNLKT